MNITNMFPQPNVIKYMSNYISYILKNNLHLDILVKSCLLLRNKLYHKYLLNNSNGVIGTNDLFIPLSFVIETRRYIDKNISKLTPEGQLIIQDILKVIDLLDSSNQPMINNNVVNLIESMLSSNIPDQELKEKLQGFILPLVYFCNRNDYEYTGLIVVPKYLYANYTCYVTFIELKTYKFKIERSMYAINFVNYMLSFQPAIMIVTVNDWKTLSYETIDFFRSFSIPTCNSEQPIFNILDIRDIGYLLSILPYININITTKRLIVLFYNTVLASIFEQPIPEETDKEIAHIIELVKIIGSVDIEKYINILGEMQVTHTNNNSMDSDQMEAMEGYLNIWDKGMSELFNISLEATGTNEDDITTSDEDDIPNEDDTSDEDDNPDEDNTSDEDENEQQDPISKLGIELDSGDSSLFDILTKFTYYKQLKEIINNTNISSVVRLLAYHWMKYWIFISTVDSTKKFIKRIKSQVK